MKATEPTADARTMRQVVWGTVLVAFTFLVLGSVALPNLRPRGFIAVGVVTILGGVTLRLIRKGSLRTAAWLYLVGFAVLVNAMIWTGGGVWAAGMTINPILVLAAGLLLDDRVAVGLALLVVANALAMTLAEYGGWLPPSMIVHTPISMWLLSSLVMGLVIVVQRASSGTLREALSHAREEIRERQAAELARQKSEAEQRHLEDQLRHSQKLQALGTLAGGIAHDFNNLLASIRANVTLAMEGLESADPATECLTEVARAGDRAADMVKRILLFSSQEDVAPKPFELRPVVEDALRLLRPNTPSGVTVSVRSDPDLPPVSGDASQIHQVVMNLAQNAFHAMTPRGGTLTIEARAEPAPPLDDGPRVPSAPAHVHLVVRDEGCGMTPEVLERIFDPFFTTRQKEHGTGLGLSVVHGIVQNHGGTIRVESEPERGATFHLILPAAEPGSVAPTPREAVLRGNGERVMLVDDEQALLLVMTKLLRRLGYDPRGFADPHAALEAFRGEPRGFDAAVIDERMPGMRGTVLAMELAKIRPDFPIARTSGERLDQTEDGMNGPIRPFIPKPSSMEQISRSLHELLNA